ncbi:hypothetical protein [Pseudalkalibacillus hwajinpoensis]|uniref:Glycosyl transferase n=1 Tax=Guptibacillus hwajinpoensis TaxID=208199 RepID=A0A4U1MNJ7_9BACL|nr:hypothetical protein [Pseudalkalibacillus hwajinpoensis]TKD72265.1 hypothetical protein FBF83_05605 [Pseudalkalibacillus hwajinpoensis]
MDYSKVIIGSVCLLISSILLSAQYITAAIMGIGRNRWGPNAINELFTSGGYLLITLSVLFFIVGIFLYLLHFNPDKLNDK